MWDFVSAGVRSSTIVLLLIGIPRCADGPPLQRPVSSVDVRGTLEALLGSQDSELGVLAPAERAELQELYRPDNYSLLWLDATGRPTGDAREALDLLGRAAEEGLEPADYYQDLLGRLTPRVEIESPASPESAAFDAAVSAGMLRYLRHLHMGRVDPRTIGFRVDAPRDQHDFPALLRSAIADHRVKAAAADLRPPLAQYRALREMLAPYRFLANDTTLVAPPPFTTTVHPQETYGALAVLYHELVALGDLPADTPVPPDAGRYDGALVDGVRRFQIRHGLEADGILGARTVAALRVAAPGAKRP